MPDPKQPPYSIEAEQSVLGGLLLDNRAWNELADRLSEADFYRVDHQLIYKAICDLIGFGRPCDFVTLAEHLRTQEKLEEAGGLSYLARSRPIRRVRRTSWPTRTSCASARCCAA